jgi:hypothetical protein
MALNTEILLQYAVQRICYGRQVTASNLGQKTGYIDWFLLVPLFIQEHLDRTGKPARDSMFSEQCC